MKRISLFICLLFVFMQGRSQGANEAFRMGFSAYSEGNFEVAIKYFNIAIIDDHNRSYFYYNRGMAYKATGNNAQALADFQRSNDLKPSAEAHYQAGLIKYKKDDLEGAKAEFESAKLMREDLDNMNFYLGMIYFKDKNYEEALKCYVEFTNHVRNNADAFYYRGFCEAKVGKYSEALLSLKAALIYKDRDWKFYYKMYEVNVALGDKQNALNNLSMIIETGNAKPEFYEDRAQLYKEAGYDFKAEEDIASAKRMKETTGGK